VKLSEFLEEQGLTPQGKTVYQAFIDNFDRKYNMGSWAKHKANVITSMCWWADTVEGTKYWEEIDTKLQKEITNLDNDMLWLLDEKEPPKQEPEQKQYPRWFEGIANGLIVKFDGLQSGVVIQKGDTPYHGGEYSNEWVPHVVIGYWVETKPVSIATDEEVKTDKQISSKKDGDIPYYDVGGIPVIDFIEAKLTPEELKGYHKGSIIAYLARAKYKFDGENEKEDYRKAHYHTGKLAEL